MTGTGTAAANGTGTVGAAATGKLPDGRSEDRLDQLIELAKMLDGVPPRSLRRAVRAMNYQARTQRLEGILSNATTALGILVAGGLVLAFLKLGYEMAHMGEAGYGCVVCGVPATSIATIFVLKQTPAAQTLGKLLPRRRRG
ncbi:hypothetical protein AB0K09_10450 [Streptomyces sp. NPDC049577]|uniref:hypothetical protein n=1 Tax=Streptomyces sp. NPDC049577 TaxID=3155153 RepID=UPI00341688EE